MPATLAEAATIGNVINSRGFFDKPSYLEPIRNSMPKPVEGLPVLEFMAAKTCRKLPAFI
jgi:hypothetical protein